MNKNSSRHLKPAALAVILAGVSPALVAQTQVYRDGTTRDDHNQPARQADTLERDRTANIGGLRADSDRDPRGKKASDLFRTNVQGSDNERLGDLRDFVVDTRSGKITHAVVSSGGILGFGANLRAVPIDAIRYNHAEDHFVINMNEERWEQAPVLTREQLQDLNRGTRIQEIAAFFGQQAGERQQDARERLQDRDAPQQLALASDIRGQDVNVGDDRVGRIDDLLISLESRQVVAIFDANRDFAGVNEDFLVPLARFQGFGHDDGLATQLTRQDFANATPAMDSGWATAQQQAGQQQMGQQQQGGQQGGIYLWHDNYERATEPRVAGTQRGGHTTEPGLAGTGGRDHDRDRSPAIAGQQPYASPGGLPGAGLPGAGNMEAEPRVGAQPPVEEVRRAVQQAEGAQMQGNVRVEAKENRIVLRGTVPDRDTKERIESRAENAARGWDVESELRVSRDRDRN